MKKLIVALIFIAPFFQLNAKDNPLVIPLWENGAPEFEHLKDEAEKAKDWWVKNVHNPSITLFRAEKPNGAAILIFPGGGHRELVFDEEGTKAAKFLNDLGITAGVVKYRLFREEGSPYQVEHPKQDALRAMRLMRSKAGEWKIDSNRIGIMGFSAGGEVVNMIAFDDSSGNPNAKDKVERHSAKANFTIQIYPGPLGIPEKVAKNAPPTFLLTSNNDKCCSVSVLKLLTAYRQADASVEAHFLSMGDHGFNMGDRSNYRSISHWPDRLADWLIDHQFFVE
jgi:acetyl esterase/lipase